MFTLADYTSEDVELHEMEVHESLVDFENEEWDYIADAFVDEAINITLNATEQHKYAKSANKSAIKAINLIGFRVVIVFQRHNVCGEKLLDIKTCFRIESI